MALSSTLKNPPGAGVDAHRTNAAVAPENPDMVLAASAAIDSLGTHDATRILLQGHLRWSRPMRPIEN
jgi:hypothetical protein